MRIVIAQPMYDVQILSIGIAQLCAVSTDIAFATVPTQFFEKYSAERCKGNATDRSQFFGGVPGGLSQRECKRMFAVMPYAAKRWSEYRTQV